jgi:thiamine biosynthesis lipoprotein
MSDLTFDAMGCEIALGGAAAHARDAIARLFHTRELVFSRFIADSELNRVNGSAGRPTLVSPLFAETLRIALDAEEETGGLVTPTLGGALVAAGYTRDSAVLTPDPRPVGPAEGAQRIVVLGRVVGLPPGVQLDLNGVVKSLAVDDAMALFRGDGFVSAGGDVATRGPLTVALPGGGAVSLQRGALATSGSTKRRWLRGGQIQHHLLDARTGRSAMSPWASVTACGATCVAADVAAKAGFLAGDDGPAWLDGRAIPARFVGSDGAIVTNERWARSISEAVACT